MTLALSAADDRRTFVPGERVQFTLAWDLDANPCAIEVSFEWETSGEVHSEASVALSYEVPVDGASGTMPVTLELPSGPYAFDGRWASLHWRILANPVGRSRPRARIPIQLGPDGVDVQLGRIRNPVVM